MRHCVNGDSEHLRTLVLHALQFGVIVPHQVRIADASECTSPFTSRQGVRRLSQDPFVSTFSQKEEPCFLNVFDHLLQTIFLHFPELMGDI